MADFKPMNRRCAFHSMHEALALYKSAMDPYAERGKFEKGCKLRSLADEVRVVDGPSLGSSDCFDVFLWRFHVRF
jgi:hypothetical protein